MRYCHSDPSISLREALQSNYGPEASLSEGQGVGSSLSSVARIDFCCSNMRLDMNRRDILKLASLAVFPTVPGLAIILRPYAVPNSRPAAPSAPSGDGWMHEVKFDGYRVQAHKSCLLADIDG